MDEHVWSCFGWWDEGNVTISVPFEDAFVSLDHGQGIGSWAIQGHVEVGGADYGRWMGWPVDERR